MERIDCQDCQRRLYDLETGRPKTYRAGRLREERYYWAKDGHKPPCRTDEGCPKGTPETAKDNVLSRENAAVVEYYHAVRASSGAVMTEEERASPIVAENLAICERIYSEFRQHQQDRSTMRLAELLAGMVRR